MKALIKHLSTCCDIVRPVRLTFQTGGKNTQTIDGCYYEQTCEAPEGASNPGSYRRKGIMLLGRVRCYIRKTRVDKKLYGNPTIIVSHPVCFQLAGNVPEEWKALEWYIAAYYLGEANEMQPLGENMIMGQWSSGGKIDDYESITYRRVTVTIKLLETI
jgi:hypothetical protein